MYIWATLILERYKKEEEQFKASLGYMSPNIKRKRERKNKKEKKLRKREVSSTTSWLIWEEPRAPKGNEEGWQRRELSKLILVLWAGKMAQSVKSLLCKHEFRSSEPMEKARCGRTHLYSQCWELGWVGRRWRQADSPKLIGWPL